MRNRIYTLVLLFLFAGVNAQEYLKLIAEADKLYEAKDYRRSVDIYSKAFKIESRNPGHLYNGACASSLAGNTEKAFTWLNLSIDRGWTNLKHLSSDTDLENLHSKKEWDKTLGKLEKKLKLMEANYDKPLQAELLAILEEDQKYRIQINETQKKFSPESKEMQDLWRMISQVDSINLIKVKKILDEKGWVGKDKIGAQANSALFLVIQHADLETQKKYLPMMKEAVTKGNASPGSLALLIDRIEIREGRKQVYGSQIGTHPNNKTMYVLPLTDPDNVDKRRAGVGLGPISDYIKNWNLTWDIEKYKRELPELEKLNK
jgi:tetratricopeptide (TPR) repeat protein